ncbi:MAG: hypothetical protein QOF90_1722 [Acetobacteraceae bacterium]|jgi:hypothetical protein|nr:hypothetical protein [Acetobacteraceae bacterium]
MRHFASVAAVLGLAAVGATAMPHEAHAWWRGGVGIGVWVPSVVVVPPPVVYAPPPVAYASPPVAYAPPPVAYAPSPYYPTNRIWVPPHWEGPYWVHGHWS